jgi:hypothetical protein
LVWGSKAVLRNLRIFGAFLLAVVMTACGGGGGDSTSTTIRCGNADCQLLNEAVATAFVQTSNNMRVSVDDLGPHGFGNLGVSTNMLFADVTVCVPGGLRSDPRQCTTIDHVLVDTGSVGLRVLASKVTSLNLPPITVSASVNVWQCFPFVIGGLWGSIAGADVWLGQQVTAAPVAVQVIDDLSALAPTADCKTVTDSTPQQSNILATAGQLGANGILGIGSTTLDCGFYCDQGTYHVSASDPPGSSALYYACPVGATDSRSCNLTPISPALQVFNPVAKLPAPYNNGVLLKMPAIPANNPGAQTAKGELILGIDVNNLPPNRVDLGTDTSRISYLSIKTLYKGQTFENSYLDTGTNGMFFHDASITACDLTQAATLTVLSYWYCPATTLTGLTAILSDGDRMPPANPTDPVRPPNPPVAVAFQIANYARLSLTNNTAFSDLAGAVNASGPANTYVADTQTFAWGLPFFYGKQVYMSIWQQPGSPDGPWYAWTAL